MCLNLRTLSFLRYRCDDSLSIFMKTNLVNQLSHFTMKSDGNTQEFYQLMVSYVINMVWKTSFSWKFFFHLKCGRLYDVFQEGRCLKRRDDRQIKSNINMKYISYFFCNLFMIFIRNNCLKTQTITTLSIYTDPPSMSTRWCYIPP